jgi:hypothetical protein
MGAFGKGRILRHGRWTGGEIAAGGVGELAYDGWPTVALAGCLRRSEFLPIPKPAHSTHCRAGMASTQKKSSPLRRREKLSELIDEVREGADEVIAKNAG